METKLQQFVDGVKALRLEREECIQRLAEIDRALQAVTSPVSTVKPPPSTPHPKRPRRPRAVTRSGYTAKKFIERLLRYGGPATTKEINRAWTQDGRRGNAHSILSQMFGDGMLRRHDRKRGSGSVYELKK